MTQLLKNEIIAALNKVEQIVIDEGYEDDITYFTYHKKRYLRMALSLKNHFPDKDLVVLNIGSHYLHVSLLFQFLGYKVDSLDVAEFWNLDFIFWNFYQKCRIIKRPKNKTKLKKDD